MTTARPKAQGTEVRLYRALSLAFVSAAAYHAYHALTVPRVGRTRRRHAAFVIIDSAFARALIVRPAGLHAAFMVLSAQQVLSHGRLIRQQWSNARAIAWLDAAVLLTLLVGNFLMWNGNRQRALLD